MFITVKIRLCGSPLTKSLRLFMMLPHLVPVSLLILIFLSKVELWLFARRWLRHALKTLHALYQQVQNPPGHLLVSNSAKNLLDK